MHLVLDPRLVLDDRCRWSAPSILRRRRSIVKVHRLLYSFLQPRLYSCGELWHQSQNLGPLVSRERRQHEIGQILVKAFSFLARPDSDSQSRVVPGVQRRLDALEPVVPARTAARADPDSANG